MSRLPLFPLSAVLFPGMRMPLHIFEPRYRRLLLDCLEGDRTFGLMYRPDESDEPSMLAGHVGCRAIIGDVEPLADGRANIIVSGDERFSLVRLIEDPAPYTVGQVEPFVDATEPVAQVTALSLRLRELFSEAAIAARALADETAPPPELPDDPATVGFAVAASVDMTAADRQRLLASPSPSARMRELIMLLVQSMPTLVARAATHARAKTNGRGPKHSL
jgi:Lon protease-like protein